MQRSTFNDAVYSLSAAIDLLRKFPGSPERIRQELSFLEALGKSFIALKGYPAPEIERVYTREEELCRRLGDPPELFFALHGLWVVHYLRGELRLARKLIEQALKRAQAAQHPIMLLHAHAALGMTLFSMAEFGSARENLEAALTLYSPERDDLETGISLLGYTAIALARLGYPDQAAEKLEKSLALLPSQARPYDLAWAKFSKGRFYQTRREARRAREAAETLIALCEEHGFSFWLAQAIIERGGALAEQGRIDESIALMERGLAMVPGGLPRPQYLCLLAEAYRRADRIDDGLNALREALAIVAEYEIRDYEAEMHRLKGELLLTQSDSNAAEARKCFARAIEIARRQKAKSWELRATTSLAVCSHRKGVAMRRARCSPKSTTGSPKALTPPTSRMPKPCLTNWPDRLSVAVC